MTVNLDMIVTLSLKLTCMHYPAIHTNYIISLYIIIINPGNDKGRKYRVF